MYSKKHCLNKLEVMLLMLRMQSKLISLLDDKNEMLGKIEENYDEIKTEFFQIKTSLVDPLVNNDCSLQDFYGRIQRCMTMLTDDRLRLLKCIPHYHDRNIIPVIERLFSEMDRVDVTKDIDESLCKSKLNKIIDDLNIKSISLCEMKHRLLFFELKTLLTQTNILNYLNHFFSNNEKVLFDVLVEKNREYIEQAKQCYQSVDTFLVQNKQQGLLSVDAKLEEQLAKLYDQRVITQKKLLSLTDTAIDKFDAQQVDQLSLQKINIMPQLLISIEVLLDRINALVNYAEDVDEVTRTDFISLLDQVEQDTKEICLVYFYADKFPIVYRLQTIILLQNGWQKILQNSVDALNKQYLNKASIAYVIAVKQLLGEYKNYHYVSICERLTHSQVLNSLVQFHEKHVDIEVPVAIRILQQQRQMSQLTIEVIELNLSQYSLTLSFAASLIRLLKNNWYYRIAESYIKSSHEITLSDSLRNIPIVGKKLSDSQLKILTGIQTTVFIAIEIAIAQSIGISYSLIASLIEYIVPDINVLNRVAKYICLDEVDTINSLATIKWVAGLQMQLLIHMMISKNADNLILPIGSYVSSSLFRSLTTQLITYVSNCYKQNKQTSHSSEFGKFLALSGAHFLGHWLWLSVYPVLDAVFTKPSEQDLLKDPFVCKQYPEECQSIALKTLQLSQGVSSKDIKEQFKKLALQHHPDKNNGRYIGSFFEDIRHAKQRALECAARDFAYSNPNPTAKR